MNAANFPWRCPALIVSMAFTDGRGPTLLTLRLVDADETAPPLFTSDAVFDFTDPLAVSELAFYQVDVIFPRPGEYRLQLHLGEQRLRERRLVIGVAPTNGQV